MSMQTALGRMLQGRAMRLRLAAQPAPPASSMEAVQL
jgi:hypothetical protein